MKKLRILTIGMIIIFLCANITYAAKGGNGKGNQGQRKNGNQGQGNNQSNNAQSPSQTTVSERRVNKIKSGRDQANVRESRPGNENNGNR